VSATYIPLNYITIFQEVVYSVSKGDDTMYALPRKLDAGYKYVRIGPHVDGRSIKVFCSISKGSNATNEGNLHHTPSVFLIDDTTQISEQLLQLL